jgi:hypothetical protein
MTSQILDNHEQIAGLLPAYLNGRLEETRVKQVREHLLSCAVCQQELAAWESIQGATRLVMASTPLPSAQLMNAVWARIDASAEKVQPAWRWSPGPAPRRFWLVFRSQISLIHKSIWVASALVCLFGLILSVFMAFHQQDHRAVRAAGQLLVLFIVITGASGCGFIYGSSIDPGFEWTIATPTSMRLLMLCRMIVVLGYNLLLGMLASIAFAAVNGIDLWAIVQFWLGPLLFLSSFCLTASLFIGSTLALICTAVIEVLQSFPSSLVSHLAGLPLPSLNLGSTSPTLLILAVLLVACAAFFVPRQPRLAS